MNEPEVSAVARVQIAFRPFRGTNLPRPTAPRGTEEHPWVRCIYRSEGGATDVQLMTGAAQLDPYVLYEVDAVFLNSEFALAHIREGESFDVPSSGSPLGLGKMLRWVRGYATGVQAVGDARALFGDR
ncbi:hypothetical protein [Curtobacterium sp. ISL-83]|uniref:hypothetical protein n=1 Tax=Curtobacterium sp. ISL-83 TaxID=2819145 RepID=UPI001BEBE77C|nr:hypothetical protein [Curtobacterium sp. ISL-83]MBT2502390.1 hypothetical protein [Curtobacterium sp. ISL-83]